MTLGLLMDIDGVMVTSWKALPGAVEAVRILADRGLPRMFLTNTTSRSRGQIADALNGCGFEVSAEEILTAAKLTAEYLAQTYPGKKAWVLNEGPIADDMTGIALTDDPSQAQVVVLGGAGPVFTHRALSIVLELMLAGVPVVAMHRSMIWSTAQGLAIDTGVYLEGLEKASGRKIRAIGKPSPLGFRAAVEMMNLEPTQVVMVGDDMHNDVLGAQASALIGVLVRTGKFREEALAALQRDEFGPVPDHVIDSIADLPALIEKLDG
ncbi:HAD-superfamily hydrolase, subfamily IIA [Gordonia polyisoprenivorans VH2]|uniref:HAD-superfamily hydrolase, subfamily IIA n=1 Tax=Gordonia polyisoprenivorans (strain DSM 44266 / VH2) TaxID=1112204 RepID=H6MYP5_GORPV|nr:HAD-IIA family hydrolase [Gordonia polyisoprenivorans]AFA71923.1 HAD-superfamily hydrolase, subfamily IIA [Gordonia polyisoprenivorans VH2]QTI70260.1 HAD-IIA family hydrolase [Gordonia polyisoprenivorans]